MSTLQISLPDELQNWVEAQARRRGYADASEFVGVLVREDKAKQEVQAIQLTDEEILGGRTEAEVVALLNESLASGRVALTVDLWAEMLGEVDEEARQKGLKSNLRDSFLAEMPEDVPEPAVAR